MNLAVRVRHGGRIKFARVKVPGMLPRLVPLPAGLSTTPGTTFVFLEDVIRRNVRALFPGTQVEGAHLFRVIRDTDMVIQEDEADDLLEIGRPRAEAAALRRPVAAAGRSRHAAAGARHPDRQLRGRPGRGRAHQRAHGARRPRQRLRAAPPGAEGSGVPSAHAVGARRHRRGVRADRRPGLPGPPSVRFVHVGGDVPEGGGGRPARRGDQDHALPHRRRLAAGRSAHPGRRPGQAGGGAGRAEGALRREEQHRLGDAAGIGRHPRRLRPGQPQGPLQAVPGGAQGDRRHPPLRARRHRQLQPHHLARLHRPRAVHRRPGDRRRRERGVQHAHRLLEQAQLPRAAGRAGRACAPASAP